MQQQRLKNIIAKLKLKELEIVDRLSDAHNDYVIRCITDPITHRYIAVNGSWDILTGYNSSECVGKLWKDFIPTSELSKVFCETQELIKDSNGFNTYKCNFIKRDGSTIYVNWKSKYYKEINAVVSIGRVPKNKVLKYNGYE